MINCSYTNPVTASGAVATSSQNFQFASSTCVTVSDTIATTSDIAVVAQMRVGDIIVASLLLIMIIITITVKVAHALSTIPVFLKRKDK